MPRTIIVTGAGSGIGATTAALLRERGDVVVGVDLRGAEVEADLSTPEGRKAGADAAVDAAGGTVDAVVACAGIAAPIALTTAVNYFGVVEFLEHVRPALAASAAPRVAITSSFSSLQPVSAELVDAMLAGDEPRALEIGGELERQGPQVGFQNYSSSKRGVARWIRKAGPTAEWGGAGIALNAVGPGVVETPMTRDLIAGDREALAAQIPMPLNGFAPPAAIAEVLAFLVSEGNSHMTGQTIYVDGGAEALLRGDDIIGQLPPVGGDAPPDLQER